MIYPGPACQVGQLHGMFQSSKDRVIKQIPNPRNPSEIHCFQIPPSLLETMLGHVEAGYTQNGNPYHNNMHACDVVQTVHYFISQSGIGVRITKTRDNELHLYSGLKFKESDSYYDVG